VTIAMANIGCLQLAPARGLARTSRASSGRPLCGEENFSPEELGPALRSRQMIAIPSSLCLARVPQRHLGIGAQRQDLLLARKPIRETPEARAVRIHEHEQALEIGDFSRL